MKQEDFDCQGKRLDQVEGSEKAIILFVAVAVIALLLKWILTL